MDFEEKYKDEEIGMFFMKISCQIDRDLTFFRKDRDRMCRYFSMLGCACQGRIEEVKNHYKNIVASEKNQLFIDHLKGIEPLLLKMAKLSDIEVKGMILGESLGQYEDRTLRANKEFMKLYDILRKSYIVEIAEILQIKKVR